MSDLRRVPLHDLHEALGGRMVPFAGYEMPVQFEGVMPEHNWTRTHAGLFDVSHMGQVILRPKSGDIDDAALALERLVPAAILGLGEGRQRYALFTNEHGGILDDLMVANRGDHLFLVVNAARKDHDLAHLRAHLSDACQIEPVEDRALLALQGPQAETALARLVPGVAGMRFMDSTTFDWDGTALWVSRSGYTGEDGFEISVPEDRARALADALLGMEEVRPIGLGARDSLRLEAGMPLYGHDIAEVTGPAGAGLGWSIQKARRTGGAREGGFPGAAAILPQLDAGPARMRVGLRPEGRAPMREHTLIFSDAEGGDELGHVTSGGFGPTIGGPIAMAYVPKDYATPGTRVWGEVRGKRLPALVCDLPFRAPTYKR